MATITKKFKIGLSKEDIEKIKEELGSIEVDTSLSPTSENPIANKTVAQNFSQVNTDIAAINAAQNLLDIVATFQDLDEYETTNLKINDKIKVLHDEENDNVATYYRWTGKLWEFIAPEPVPKIEVENQVTEGSNALVSSGTIYDFVMYTVDAKINEEITTALNADYTIGGE